MKTISSNKFTNYYYPIFSQFSGLTAISSTLKFPFRGVDSLTDQDSTNEKMDVLEKEWYAEIGLNVMEIIKIQQVHGNNVKIIGKNNEHCKFDSVITNQKNKILRIVTADCLPVFIFDKNNGVIGLIHAGWRGMENKIIEKTISKMKSEFEIDVESILVAVGPFIRKCCYEVGLDVAEKFNNKFSTKNKNSKYMLDLSKIVREQLSDMGFSKNNIWISEDCTYCSNEMFFSARRGKENFNRNIHILGLRRK